MTSDDDQTSRTAIEIVEASVPESLDAPDAWPLHGASAVSRACEAEIHGNTDLALDAATARATMLAPEYRQVRRLVAVSPGNRTAEGVLGQAMVGLPQVGNSHTARIFVGVHPEHRHQGVGSALAEAALDIVRASGRRLVLSDAAFSPEPPPGPRAIEAPTGSGRIPLDGDATRFLLAHDMTLEQVARHSVLRLPVPPDELDAHRARAQDAAGDDYRVHVWHVDPPSAWLDSMAVLKTRMSTDAPSGDVDLEEDPWDAARVLAAATDIRERGQGRIVVAAEHVPSGALAAFTEVAFPLDLPEVVFQNDTLVLREHRGRRLGMLVKASLLAELARVRPAAARIHTWNAAENAHMLAINVALGFRVASVEAEWSRDL